MPTEQGGPAVTMRVQPEEVVRLKTRLEAVKESVETFIQDNRRSLVGAPLAEDEVSQDAAKDFADNAESAVNVTRQFIDQLNLTIANLEQAVTSYNLVDDTHATDMQQLIKDH